MKGIVERKIQEVQNTLELLDTYLEEEDEFFSDYYRKTKKEYLEIMSKLQEWLGRLVEEADKRAWCGEHSCECEGLACRGCLRYWNSKARFK